MSPPSNVEVEESPLQPVVCESNAWFEEGPPIPFLHVPLATAGDRNSTDLGGAVAACDFDHDGHEDLFFGQGDGCNALFLGDGTGDFSPREIGADLEMCDHAVNVTIPGDWNGDGQCDLIVGAQHAPDALFLNVGGAVFERVDDPVMASEERSAGMVPGDFDNDGLLDVYVAYFLSGGGETDVTREIAPNRLLLGNGDGTFTDASARLPREHSLGAGMIAAQVWNYQTGGLDLFVANDKGETLQPNHYSRNEGGRFVSAGDEIGFNQGLGSMGLAVTFLEGARSFFITSRLNLLLVDHGGLLVEATHTRGVMENDAPTMAWGGTWLRTPRDDGTDGILVWGQGKFRHQVATTAETRDAPYLAVTTGSREPLERRQADEPFFDLENRHGFVRADFNEDGVPDLVSMNTWTRRPHGVQLSARCFDEAPVHVELQDHAGHPPYGIEVRLGDRKTIYGADNGMFGGAWPAAFFAGSGTLEVKWADGAVTEHAVTGGHRYLVRRGALE